MIAIEEKRMKIQYDINDYIAYYNFNLQEEQNLTAKKLNNQVFKELNWVNIVIECQYRGMVHFYLIALVKQ